MFPDILPTDMLIGERAKRARHSQVCSIENRDIYIYIIVRTYVTLALWPLTTLITRKEGGA